MITENQCRQILELMRECGAFMRTAHNVDADASQIHIKPGPANFVTDYDVAVQTRLMENLSRIVPGANFFAEEKENSPALLKNAWCFIIDPIDGTTNFIHDMRASVISVGLFYDEKPVFGAVYDPYGDEMFYAVSGKGAFVNGRPIHVSSRPFAEALVCFGSAPYDRAVLAKQSFAIAAAMFDGCADIRRSGSAALDLCYLAAGRTEVFFEAVLSPWDYAAGSIILQEAGGKITDFSGAPVALGARSQVLGTNAVLHDQMQALINQIIA